MTAAFQRFLVRVASTGWGTLRGWPCIFGPSYFAILHQLIRLLSMGRRAMALRSSVGQIILGSDIAEPRFDPPGREISDLPTGERHRLLAVAARLMDDWPTQFVACCQAAGFWRGALLADMGPCPPFPYVSPVTQSLDRSPYSPNHAEAKEAKASLRERGQPMTAKDLKRYLSTASQIRSGGRSYSPSKSPKPPYGQYGHDRPRGRGGRPFALGPGEVELAKSLVADGFTHVEIARELGVHRSTIRRALGPIRHARKCVGQTPGLGAANDIG